MPLLRGCSQNLVSLDLSENKFVKKPGPVVPTFEQFFASAVALKEIDLSGTKIPNNYLAIFCSKLFTNRMKAASPFCFCSYVVFA